MASKLEEDYSCPVCFEIFKDPVLLSCSHTVCKVCLQQFWESKGFRECPICRTRLSSDSPPRNLVLKNLCETFLQQKSQRSSEFEVFCSLHSEKLQLFCLEDKQPVCLVCRDSKIHKTHNFSPISEAVIDYKEDLWLKLQSLKKTLERSEEALVTYDQINKHIKSQAQNTETEIKKEFEKLHQFLQDEEATRIAALREEEEQRSQMMKEKIEKMSREISSLSETIRTLEDEMGVDDIAFLQNYKSTVER
ncbi:E3 ubiquitin-protein ligase TRIM35-like [Sardina pilchardus]|uniref:E3 ubiquitin-protein ligase TRIM35-like n=1 Tax=Sardina pilchardus TaxID=27697 RepID=UPI002E0EB0A3